MPREQLGRLLEDLAAQLEEIDTLDEGDRAALEHLQLRIAAALSAGEAPDEGPTEAIGDLVDRFEASHPTLTMTLGRIMDALNKLGI
jgi:hypothetical protein